MIPDQNKWWRLLTNIGDIAVFHVDLAPHPRHEAEGLACLDGEECARWERFQSLPARRRYVLCRAALRAILCCHLNCANDRLEFVALKHGKPFAKVDGKPVEAGFNVSHSGEHGLIAVAPGGRLGVDVEERDTRRNLEGLIRAVFSPEEQAEFDQFQGSEKLHLFFRFWTLKEALVKAHGKGLSLEVSKLELPIALRRGAKRSICHFPQIPETTWCLEDISTDDFAAAVAYEVESVS